MAVVEYRTPLTHRSLMNKSKYDLASLVLTQNRQATAVIRGLMEIAKLAMPDTYFATDTRVGAGRAWLQED